MNASSSSTASISVSTQTSNTDKRKKLKREDEIKNDGCFCLARRKGSSALFSAYKCFLCIIFTLAFIYEMTYNVLCVKFYKDSVQDIRDSHIWAPRTLIQVESAHGHFFLINAMLLGPTLIVGLLGIIREHIIMIAGYAYAHIVITGFDVMAAWQSHDQQVILRTGILIVPAPILVIMALIFGNMCRKNDRSLVKSAAFKKFRAQRAGKGETMAHDDEKNNNHTLQGVINGAAELNDEAV